MVVSVHIHGQRTARLTCSLLRRDAMVEVCALAGLISAVDRASELCPTLLSIAGQEKLFPHWFSFSLDTQGQSQEGLPIEHLRSYHLLSLHDAMAVKKMLCRFFDRGNRRCSL